MEIKNSVCIVTGASKGIGLEISKLLSERGAKVVLVARSTEILGNLEQEIPNSFAVPTDMRNPFDIEAMMKKVIKRYGQIDLLINNAGQGMRSLVEETNINDFKEIMELNLYAVVKVMQEIIPVMRSQNKGLIINISSLVSKTFIPGLGAYSATKYALNCISNIARLELEKDNIKVCLFYPKLTATDFGQSVLGKKYDSTIGVREGLLADTPHEVAIRVLQQIESEETELSM